MKYYVTLLITLLSTSLEAKSDSAELKWSVGLRSGLMLRDVNLTSEYDLKAHNRSWENQLLVTKMIGKGFELDLSFGHSQKKAMGTNQYDTTTYNYDDKVKTISAALLLRYNFLKINRTSAFIHGGFSIDHLFVKNNTDAYYPSSNKESFRNRWNSRTGKLIIGTGIRHQLHNKISVNGQLDTKYREDLYTINGVPYSNNWSLSILVGVAYHF